VIIFRTERMLAPIDAINLAAMRSPRIVAHYARKDDMHAHEIAALDSVATSMLGVPILDIGVGGGRTAPMLSKLSGDYLGIDYSQEMVSACQRRFPGLKFDWMDARKMDRITTASVGLAVFSCNGISMVGHDDRLAILREVVRVLRPGGKFVFTTYNRNSPAASAGFCWPDFVPTRHLLRLAVRSARFGRDTMQSLINRRRALRHEQTTPDYAVINDPCHNHGVMLYYITLERQRQQLIRSGFGRNIVAFDGRGRLIADDTRTDSMALVAQKPG
jgi:SAM-dependent methyltransferase